jgi:N-acyl-D-amino-acid deacylase
VVFDPQKFEDTATFENQLSPPRGVRYVFVNGELAVKEGEILPTPRGVFLRRINQMLE